MTPRISAIFSLAGMDKSPKFFKKIILHLTKHHDKVNIKCEWIVEVALAKDQLSK